VEELASQDDDDEEVDEFDEEAADQVEMDKDDQIEDLLSQVKIIPSMHSRNHH
jgi:hypothetical protein